MDRSRARTARLIKNSGLLSSRTKTSLALRVVQRFEAMACLPWGKRDKF
jgi:hypothetical protein